MIYFILIFISLILSAVFSATETAFIALSEIETKILIAKYTIRGKIIQFLQKRKAIFVSAMVVGNNAANILFSVVATQYTVLVFGERFLFIATIIIIVVMLVFGEIPPKQLALRYHIQFVSLFSFVFLIFFILLWPAARFFSFFGAILEMFLRKKDTNEFNTLSQDHLTEFLYQMRFIKNIPQDKTRRITRALTLSDTSIENIMTHRKDVFSLSADCKLSEAIAKINQTFYVNIPVYANDDNEQIIGILHAPQLVKAMISGNIDDQIKTIMNDAVILQESHSVEYALNVFKEKNIGFAIVLDEYGGLAGVLSDSDISFHVLNLQTFVNVLDVEHQIRNKHILKDANRENSFFVDGETEITTIEEMAHVTLTPRPKFHTIGGYLSEYSGGEYITSNKENTTHKKSIHHDKLGVFTILKEKNGRIILLRWKKAMVEQ